MGLLDTLWRRLLQRRARLLPVGAAAPDFDLRDQEGRRMTRSELDGRRYVLWFYPRADTPT